MKIGMIIIGGLLFLISLFGGNYWLCDYLLYRGVVNWVIFLVSLILAILMVFGIGLIIKGINTKTPHSNIGGGR